VSPARAHSGCAGQVSGSAGSKIRNHERSSVCPRSIPLMLPRLSAAVPGRGRGPSSTTARPKLAHFALRAARASSNPGGRGTRDLSGAGTSVSLTLSAYLLGRWLTLEEGTCAKRARPGRAALRRTKRQVWRWCGVGCGAAPLARAAGEMIPADSELAALRPHKLGWELGGVGKGGEEGAEPPRGGPEPAVPTRTRARRHIKAGSRNIAERDHATPSSRRTAIR